MSSGQRVSAIPEPIPQIWDAVLDDPRIQELIVLDRELPPQGARSEPFPPALHDVVRDALVGRGITDLYSHQAEAVAAALAGEDVAVVTPTASGKSLCYLLPVLDAVARDPDATAILLYPTKALAQDQFQAVRSLSAAAGMDLRTFTYDGDTPPGARSALRQAGQVVLTNPDMLHTGILPNHTSWVRLFSGLRYVVLDELHTYRGVFGSHVANVLRRLGRIASFYGASPRYICTSATIANPGELAAQLLGRPVRLVSQSGAPTPRRRLVVLNPPLVDRSLGVRRSASLEARRLVPKLVESGAQAIVFSQTRLQVELLLNYLGSEIPSPPGTPGPTVRAYRGGYLPLERRAIEAGLRSGAVRCVVATSALELGVDIGQLDAAVLVGFPGTISSCWQRLGRAGRRTADALHLLITGGGPLDQFIAHHPEYLLERAPERAVIDPDNLLVLAGHLQAAVFELPMRDGEGFGGKDVSGLLQLLSEDGLVHLGSGSWHWTADAFPAEAISLRTASSSNVVIIDTSGAAAGPSQGPQGQRSGSTIGHSGTGARVVGELDEWSAPMLVHDDAIYMHQGRQYHVERLDWEEHRAYVHPVSVDYYTDADLRVGLQVLERLAGPLIDPGRATSRSHGEVRVSVLAAMYRKIRLLTHETVGAGPIRVPERDLQTNAYWCSLGLASTWPGLEMGIEGFGHLLGQAACLLAMCDHRDLGVVTEVRAALGAVPAARPAAATAEFTVAPGQVAQSGMPPAESDGAAVFIYDSHPGGVGLSAKLFDLHQELLAAAASLLRECDCAEGCPACVGPIAGLERGAKLLTLRLVEEAGW
jgi:DEAD/DEAH box helicase domain-containing protein